MERKKDLAYITPLDQLWNDLSDRELDSSSGLSNSSSSGLKMGFWVSLSFSSSSEQRARSHQ